MPEMNECQSCGKLGGKVVSFEYDGMVHSMWICPHCGPGPLDCLKEWCKRLDSMTYAAFECADAFRKVEKIVAQTRRKIGE